jgi:hypothetical protein
MGVASCRSIFLLSDVVFNRVSVSPRFGFRFAIGFRSVVVCVVGFRPGPRPSPARSSAPQAPPHPPCVPPPSLSHFVSRATTSSPSLPPLSHLLALGDLVTVVAGFWIPRCASLSLSLSQLPPHSPSPRGAPARPRRRPRRRGGGAGRAAPLPYRSAAPSSPPCGAPTLPWRGPVWPRVAPLPCLGAAPSGPLVVPLTFPSRSPRPACPDAATRHCGPGTALVDPRRAQRSRACSLSVRGI